MTKNIDLFEFEAALKAIQLTETDLLHLEGVGAAVQISGQRIRVPVDTAATQNSIKSHIQEADADHVIDDIGPETDYAPNIEYGIQNKPNYPIQPFIRPTARADFNKTIGAIGTAFGTLVEQRWPR